MATTETRTAHRMTIDQVGYEAWVDFTVLQQRDADTGELVLLDVSWVEKTRSDGRTLRGADGVTYWFPARHGRPGHVYARHSSGMNGHGLDFETDDAFTACDLVNLASATWDGMYWPHAVDSSDTNPFRPYVAEAVR